MFARYILAQQGPVTTSKHGVDGVARFETHPAPADAHESAGIWVGPMPSSPNGSEIHEIGPIYLED